MQIYFHIPFSFLLSDAGREAWEREENLEIYLPASDLDRYGANDYSEVVNRLNDQGRALTIHGPFMDLMPASPDPMIRDVALYRFKQLFQASEVLRPRNIVLHIGYEAIKHAEFFDRWLELSVKTWSQVLQMADDCGVTVSLENIFETSYQPMLRVLEEINSPRFGFCLDVGHFQMFSEEPLAEWLDNLGGYLVELHLHDNHGQADEHITPGEGTFDFPLLAELLKKRNIVPRFYTIENHSFEMLGRSIAAVKEYFK